MLLPQLLPYNWIYQCTTCPALYSNNMISAALTWKSMLLWFCKQRHEHRCGPRCFCFWHDKVIFFFLLWFPLSRSVFSVAGLLLQHQMILKFLEEKLDSSKQIVSQDAIFSFRPRTTLTFQLCNFEFAVSGCFCWCVLLMIKFHQINLTVKVPRVL